MLKEDELRIKAIESFTLLVMIRWRRQESGNIMFSGSCGGMKSSMLTY